MTTSGDRITVSVASIGILSEHEAAIFAFRDVTLARELERELRRTSEFLERILNSTVDGIIAANMRGTILLFNQGAERICGYRAADVIGQHVGAAALSRRASPARSCASSDRPSTAAAAGWSRCAATCSPPTGEQVPVSISAALVFDDEGREIATVGIFSDLRERLHMEERLASAQEKLAVSEKQAVAIELAGAAAHELNQPLTSVMGYAQVLLRKLGPDDAHLAASSRRSSTRPIGWRRSSASSASLTRYETKSYVGGAQIIDLDRSPSAGKLGLRAGNR